MVARVRTVAFHGVEVIEVETQVTIVSGLPAFTVVGLPDKAVAVSRERVRAALGLALPPKRITVNLAPADVVKEGSHFDRTKGVPRVRGEPETDEAPFRLLVRDARDGRQRERPCGCGE